MLDFYIDTNNFAYDTEIVKETSKSIYSVGMYGDIYRVEKATNKVYRNQQYIGCAVSINIF